MPEPRTGRLSDPQHRTPRREIGRSGAVVVAMNRRVIAIASVPDWHLEDGQPDSHCVQWTSSTGSPSTSCATQSTNFTPFTSSV
jgi:hypothetical protein